MASSVVHSLPRLVIAIMATDGDHLYQQLEFEYRKRLVFYKKLYPELDYYFMKNRPNLQSDYEVHNDTNEFFVRAEESVIPGLGIKTFKFYEVMAEHYDYILRTNISSCFLIDRVYKFLCSFAIGTRLYAGYPEPYYNPGLWAFGSGYIVSKQVAAELVEHQHTCVSFSDQTGDRTKVYDDVFVGFIARNKLGLQVTPWDMIAIESPHVFSSAVETVRKNPNVLQLRIKLSDQSLRQTYEPRIHASLYTYIQKTASRWLPNPSK